LGAAPEQLDELLEQASDESVLLGPACDGDLVAAHVNVAVERALDDFEQLVAGTEKAHHRLVSRHDDLDLGLGCLDRWIGHELGLTACSRLPFGRDYRTPPCYPLVPSVKP